MSTHRERGSIEYDANEADRTSQRWDQHSALLAHLQLEVLLDIRDLLIQQTLKPKEENSK